METPDREKIKKKQFKRMGKILAKAWELGEEFQQQLSKVGEKLDKYEYKLGRHGWEDFARDLGVIYNQHIQR